MKIKKFELIENGKTVYAVTGAKRGGEAMNEVCRMRKEKWDKFKYAYTYAFGEVKGDKLYLADKGNCIIVYKDGLL